MVKISSIDRQDGFIKSEIYRRVGEADVPPYDLAAFGAQAHELYVRPLRRPSA
jgi:hypothetical protein